VITIGCAGGGDTRLFLPLSEEPADDGVGLRVSISGLKGGHSGVDIHLQRGNAIVALVRALGAAADRTPLRLVALAGGNARNAIPREATAEVLLADEAALGAVRSDIDASLEASAAEHAAGDPNLSWQTKMAAGAGVVRDARSTRRALDFLMALPHGVVSMSPTLPGLVETSTNLAVVGIEDETLSVLCNSRSSVATRLSAVRRQIRALGELAGARVEQPDGYPAWQPDVGSRLLAVIRSAYEAEIGVAAEVGAMHAGLECGIIGEKYPGMDMVAFGPQIEFPHSPDERVRVASVEPFYRVLRRTIEALGSV
jgi:dipeptidase D